MHAVREGLLEAQAAAEHLAQAGYRRIGMDHFALKTDSLFESMQNRTLHRNFMGYTASKTQLMIGLGMSAIGDSWYAFAQNENEGVALLVGFFSLKKGAAGTWVFCEGLLRRYE